MQRSNTKNWMLPKQVKLKRKSVECHSSAQWIDLSIRSNVLGPPKKPFRRICNSHSMKTDAVKVHSEDALVVVSSTSSPEDEYLTHSGHELLAIESSEQYSRSTEAAFDHISDSSSLPASQQTMEGLKVEKFTVEVTLLHDRDLPRNPSKDTSTIEYINQLKHDRSEAPYVSLMSKFPRETQLNGGVLERLHKLHRRLNSERSIWLHQRELRRGDAIETRKSKLFRVDSSNDVKSVGLPGMVSFRATVLERPFESTDLTVTVSGTRITNRKNTVILALPISGAKFQGASFSRASESDLMILLGDLIKPGDVLRIFSPWSCIPNEGSTQPPLFHSFFWVERVRDRDLPTWYTASNLPTNSSPVQSPISVACSCLASGSKFSVTTCSKRFRDSRDVYADPVETIMPQNLNMNCIFVVHCFQFWILKKVRSALLVQFHSGGSGLILLPYPVPSRNATSAQPTRSWTEPRVGGVYHAQDLLQLPVSHLPKKFVTSASQYLVQLERRLSPQFARKFSLFRSGPQQTAASTVEFGLWDARVCKFQLIEPNWIVQHPRPSYQNCLPAQSRCQITGFLLFDIPEGSNLQTDELIRMRSSVPISTNSTVFAEVLSQITHIFYLWFRYANSYTVLPCVCLPDVVLPRHLGLSGSYLSVTVDPQTTLASPPLGSLFRLDHVLVGHDFVIMDCLSTVQTELRHNVCTGIKIPKFMSMLLENSVLLNSANSLENLKAGDLVHFSGIVAQVNTRRSHTWPVCAYCHCADLRANTRDPGRSSVLRCQQCGRCLTQLEHQEQRFEVEVLVGLDTAHSRGLPHPLGNSGPQVVLNLSTTRLCNLLGLSPRELADAPQMNPKTMVHKRVDNVLGLILGSNEIQDNDQSLLAAHASLVQKRILVAELSNCGSD